MPGGGHVLAPPRPRTAGTEFLRRGGHHSAIPRPPPRPRPGRPPAPPLLSRRGRRRSGGRPGTGGGMVAPRVSAGPSGPGPARPAAAPPRRHWGAARGRAVCWVCV